MHIILPKSDSIKAVNCSINSNLYLFNAVNNNVIDAAHTLDISYVGSFSDTFKNSSGNKQVNVITEIPPRISLDAPNGVSAGDDLYVVLTAACPKDQNDKVMNLYAGIRKPSVSNYAAFAHSDANSADYDSWFCILKAKAEPFTISIAVDSGNSFTNTVSLSSLGIYSEDSWNRMQQAALLQMYQRHVNDIIDPEVRYVDSSLQREITHVADPTRDDSALNLRSFKTYLKNDGIARLPQNIESYTNGNSDDITEIINEAINNSVSGICFPSGIYKISDTIKFPYNTQVPYSISLESGARIVATKAMDSIFELGAVAKDGSERELYSITGGYFDGNGLSSNGIKVNNMLTGMRISGQTVQNTLDKAIWLTIPSSTSSHDARLSDIRIGRVHATEIGNNFMNVGIQMDGGDATTSNVYISNCMTGFKSAGFHQIENVHIFNGHASGNTVGIDVGSILGNSIYVDTMQTGIACHSFAQIDGFFDFNYKALDGSLIAFKGVDNQPVSITNMSFRTDNAQIDARGVQLYSDAALTSESNKVDNLFVDGRYRKQFVQSKNGRVSADRSGFSGNVVSISTGFLTLSQDQGVFLGYVAIPKLANENCCQSFRCVSDNAFIDFSVTIQLVAYPNGNLVDSPMIYNFDVKAGSAFSPYLVIANRETIGNQDYASLYLMYAAGGDITALSAFIYTPQHTTMKWFSQSMTKVNFSDLTVMKTNKS
jgi:hypothetical protein